MQDATTGAITNRPSEQDASTGAITNRPSEQDATVGAITNRPTQQDASTGAITNRPMQQDATTGAITNRPSEQDALVPRLKDFMLENKRSQGSIAKELGISTAAVSLYLSGTYDAPHKINPKVEQLLKINKERKETPKEPPFRETRVSKTVTNTIKYAHLRGKIALAYGDAGIGKTMTALNYIAGNPDAVMITLNPCYATIAGVNELLSEQLNVKARIERHYFAEIVRKLKNSGRVIIVDEAQHLTTRAIEYIRGINDATGAGIVFIGNSSVYSRIFGRGTADKDDFAQLFSRIALKSPVSRKMLSRGDIETVFALTDTDALDTLLKISHTNFGLRGAVNVYMNTISGFNELTAGTLTESAKAMTIL